MPYFLYGYVCLKRPTQFLLNLKLKCFEVYRIEYRVSRFLPVNLKFFSS